MFGGRKSGEHSKISFKSSIGIQIEVSSELKTKKRSMCFSVLSQPIPELEESDQSFFLCLDHFYEIKKNFVRVLDWRSFLYLFFVNLKLYRFFAFDGAEV